MIKRHDFFNIGIDTTFEIFYTISPALYTSVVEIIRAQPGWRPSTQNEQGMWNCTGSGWGLALSALSVCVCNRLGRRKSQEKGRKWGWKQWSEPEQPRKLPLNRHQHLAHTQNTAHPSLHSRQWHTPDVTARVRYLEMALLPQAPGRIP